MNANLRYSLNPDSAKVCIINANANTYHLYLMTPSPTYALKHSGLASAELASKTLPTSLLILVLVVLVHVGALALAIYSSPSSSDFIQLPTVQGILIPAPPSETVQAPSARDIPPPVEKPPEPVKPAPKKVVAKPQPKPIPIPKAPASDTAITPEEVAEKETAAPPPQPAVMPTAEDNDALGAPVTPPQEDAHQLNNPRPAYPSLSRRLREQGTVLLEILILTDGSVGEVRVKASSGHHRLDDTAMRAVKRWRYTPARRGSETIEYWYLQPIEFALN